MSHAIATVLTATTAIDLRELAGAHNGYDQNRIHPISCIIAVISTDGTKRSINASQLDSFLQYAEQHPHMGSALDAVARPVAEKLHVVK